MEKINLLLEGLDCPHCAEKIADRVGKLSGVSSSDMNFVVKKLTVVHNGENKTLNSDIEKIVHSLEPDVKVKPFENTQEHTHNGSDSRTKDIVRFVFASLLFAVSFFFGEHTLPSMLLAGAAYLVSGFDVVISAVRNLIKGEAFDESLLMTVATIGALALKDFREGAAVMIFFQWGELLQNIAVDRSKRSISKLMELKPETVTVVRNNNRVTVPPEEVAVGELIVVKAGENVPLDGRIVKGESSLDLSALTGESVPVDVAEGAEVLSGSVNLKGLLEIRVQREFSGSAVAKILDMVQNSSEKKAKTEKFITRFARVYTPAVVSAALAVVIFPWLVTGDFTKWLYRGLLFLVISCPCALVISVPLSFFGAIGGASDKGILIKGAKTIEALAKCKTLAVDKTGTLTEGKFTVVKIVPENTDENTLLEYAAYCESSSNHPIGKSVTAAFGGKIDTGKISNVEETAGGGISCNVGGDKVICAKGEVLEQQGVKFTRSNEAYTAVYVAVNGEYKGVILLGDKPKATSKAAVEQLSAEGVQTVMLTGDREPTAKTVAQNLGINRFYAGLLPQDKVARLEELINKTDDGKVAFAGDGINDAPVIAMADIGIAMGGWGSDIAIEAADMVLMKDDLQSIPQAVKLSRKAMVIVKENIVFALGVKLAVMILGVLGIAGMWAAVFADVGVSVLAVLNALRAKK